MMIRISLFVMLAVALVMAPSRAYAAAERPNIVIIMADDMGYSDVGCYGGEIATPNLDRLAANGLRFTQFYNTGRCCPTRASLLTGLYSHQAGVGHMTGDNGEQFPGYRGRLNKNCVTIAEVLGPAGYFTAATGKWHVGSDEPAWLPIQRGFDRFYGVPQGGGFYFRVKKGRDILLNNDVLIADGSQTPDGWYCTDAFTEYGVKFIDEAIAANKPFFLYLAHIAPHWPLQAPAEDIARYRGKYAGGWEAVRRARHQRQLEMGLMDQNWPLSPEDRVNKDWSDLTPQQRAEEERGMEIYAAVVDRMDRSVGTLVDALKQRGVFDNTLILFLSDNGGCAEGGAMTTDTGEGAPGSADSFVKYGKSWANASNTPFRKFKHYVHEGGTATPLIAHWPAGLASRRAGALTHQPAHVIDLMATCIDLAGGNYPTSRNGRAITPLEGRSLRPLLEGRVEPIHEALFWEHEGNRAVRIGDWKLVAQKNQPWELFNLRYDRTEVNDLSVQHPQKVRELAALWSDWARRAHVSPDPKGVFNDAIDARQPARKNKKKNKSNQ